MKNSTYINEAQQIELNTYRFHYYDSSQEGYYPCVSPFNKENQPQFDYLPDDFVRVKLYEVDSHKKNNSKNLTVKNLIAWRNKYFGEILFPAIKESYPKFPLYTDM